MADSCEFEDLKDSLIRDRIVFGIADNNVRECLLQVPDLTLNKALEIARAAETTQSQLKQMQNLHEVNTVGKRKENFSRKKDEENKEISKRKYLADQPQVLWQKTCTRQIKVPCIWPTV